MPTAATTLHPDDWDASPTADRYEEWAASVRLNGGTDGPPYPYHLQHLLGEPMSVQDDVRLCGAMFNHDSLWANVLGRPMDRALTTPDAWAVLLGLHADHEFGLRIHDGGAIHLLAPVADLADGRLDRLVCPSTPADLADRRIARPAAPGCLGRSTKDCVRSGRRPGADKTQRSPGVEPHAEIAGLSVARPEFGAPLLLPRCECGRAGKLRGPRSSSAAR
jgi:hypothetical protein